MSQHPHPSKLSLTAVKDEIRWAVKNKRQCRNEAIEAIKLRLDEVIADLNIIDYDRMIVRAVELMKGSPALLCSHLIIDECQDLSGAQIDVAMEVIRMSRPAVFTVGDQDQSIFQFSNGTPTPIHHSITSEEAPVRHFVQLPYNYRSTEQIVAMSQRVIINDATRLRKPIIPMKCGGSMVSVVGRPSMIEQCRTIVQSILHTNNRDCAILCRIRYMLGPITKELERVGLECQVLDGKSFYELPAIESVLNYIRLRLVTGENPFTLPSNVVETAIIQTNAAAAAGNTQLDRLRELSKSCRTLYELLEMAANVEDLLSENVSTHFVIYKWLYHLSIYLSIYHSQLSIYHSMIEGSIFMPIEICL